MAQQNSTQLGGIRKLVKTLAQQFDESKFQSLWSLVDDFKNADSDSNREKRNHDWILKALEFDGMDARRKQVKRSAKGTFRWCVTEDSIPPDHPDLKTSFRQWLATGNGVYHITGKPGSGKSTIMKLIDEAEETDEQLQCWTGTQDSKTLVRACFYTWKAADSSPLQNSIEGLERTLLHDILSGAPELTPKVFRKHWTPKNFSIANVVTQSGSTTRTRQFGLEELHHALDSIIQVHGPAHNLRLFFLIDGLDEFKNLHEHSDLSKRICSWASCNPSGIKICVSSREENAFMNNFPATQRLRLHLVTEKDVRVLTEESLRKHGHFASYPDKDRQRLIDKIVKRAEGVFLWLVLTIWELKMLLDDGQGFKALEAALRKFPRELDVFFKGIMGRIPECYYNEARAVLMVAASLSKSSLLQNHFCLFYYSMLQFDCLEACNPDTQPTSPDMSLKDAVTQTKAFISRFPSMCRGLLEMEPMDDRKSSALDPDFPPARHKLVFTHRSGYDFVQQQCGKLMPPNSDMKFDAIELILRSICRVVEALPWCEAPSPRYDHYKELIDDAIQHSCFEGTPRYAESHFASLRALEGTLLRKQHAIPDNTPFGPSLEDDDIRIYVDTISVIPIASLRAYDSYVKWALKKYPPWFATKEAKAWALRQAFHSERRHGLYSVSCSLLCADESGWFSINETIRDEGDQGIIPEFSPPLSGSGWLHFVVYYILDDETSWFPDAGGLRWMLELGAEARVRIEWWSEELSPERQEQVSHLPCFAIGSSTLK